MTSRQLSIVLLMAGSTFVWAADNKENLNKARTDYRQAVNAHGSSSPEARHARENLRATRHTFHADRRAHQPHSH